MTDRVAIYLQDAHDLREGLDIVRYAEAKGFEAVWQAESRLVRDAIVPMAAYAAVTEKIKVASGVINNWTRNIGLLAATFLTLDEQLMADDPLETFTEWMDDAIAFGMKEPNAMILATATTDGKPSARVVLLKDVSAEGFVFFTNYLSRKGRELLINPQAAVVFDWHEMARQVRVEGRVEKLSG